MIEVYGAPIADADVPKIVEYLATTTPGDVARGGLAERQSVNGRAVRNARSRGSIATETTRLIQINGGFAKCLMLVFAQFTSLTEPTRNYRKCQQCRLRQSSLFPF
jgi:hypothetical protein